MVRRRKPNALVFVVAALVVVAAGWWQQRASPSAETRANDAISSAERAAIDQTLVLIRQGGPFPHAKDGTVFQNREGRLPQRPSGYYREYTVPTPGAKNRGARRIVQGRDGDTWYTADHYNTFVRIDP